MKVSNRIILACATFMLTAAAIANESNQEPTIDDLAKEVLLPGTMVVAGDPDKNDFYIATEVDAAKITDGIKLAKLDLEAKILADKHNATHRYIKFDQKTLDALNLDMKKILNKYAIFDSKLTIAKTDVKVKEKVATKQFEPKQQPVVSHSVDAEAEPVMVPLEPAELPKLNQTSSVRKASPLLVKTKKPEPKNKLATKSLKSTPTKTIATKKPKRLNVGVVKPYVPKKIIARHRPVIVSNKPQKKSISAKYVVKSLTYDRNHRLKLVDKPSKEKLSLKKKSAGHQFEVIHLYG